MQKVIIENKIGYYAQYELNNKTIYDVSDHLGSYLVTDYNNAKQNTFNNLVDVDTFINNHSG